MSEFDITRKSRPVVVSSYRPSWADEFQRLANRIRAIVGSAAMRIDHIGSTAVPALGAKDIIRCADYCARSRPGTRSHESAQVKRIPAGTGVSVRPVSSHA
ncbi:MAG: hypothetical protein C0496_16625 [Erythrobacter sp.]|nr:hypothetical protein [Erythrobacter sp.]